MSDATAPDDFSQLAGQAVTFALNIAFATEVVLTGQSAELVIRATDNLRRAIEGGSPSIDLLLPFWQGEVPPAELPPAASVLEWVYRRGRAALGALLAASEGTLNDFSSLAERWDYAQAFARAHVPPVGFDRLSALLRREAGRAQLSPVPAPVGIDLGMAQDWAEACRKLPVGWVNLTHAQRRELLLRPKAPDPGRQPEEQRGSNADDAFRPAKEFLDSARFITHKQLRAALKRNPWIRTKKPSPQRLLIHAGDWHQFLSQLDAAASNALDAPAEMVDSFLAGARERKEEIRQRKAGK